jgi:hypothetical protein
MTARTKADQPKPEQVSSAKTEDLTPTPPPTPTEARKVTFHFETRGPEGTASIFMGEYVGDGDDLIEWLVANGQRYMNEAKVAVFEAVGQEFEFTAEGQARAIRKAEVRQPAQQQHSQRPPNRQQQQRRQGGGASELAEVGVYAQRPQFCDECGERDFYDNTGDNDAKQERGEKLSPDYKCKACGHGVWRPGSYEYNQSARPAQRGGNRRQAGPRDQYADEAPF